ncbi:MAG: iron-containing alcohol dehydrogenase family protein [Salinigranum sp.]
MTRVQYQHRYANTNLIAGPGSIEELSTVADELGAENALVVCGPTTGGTDAVMDPVYDALGDRLAGTYDAVEPHVPTRNVSAAIGAAEDAGADLLVSVGGGSAHDTAKAISILGAEGDTPHEFRVVREGDELVAPTLERAKTPIVAVPTTLSAAELNGAAAITDEDTGEKMIVTDEKAVPRAAIYDADIGVHTPASIIASTGMNTVDHTVEMVYSRHHSPFTDATALHGLKLVAEWLPRTIEDPSDVEARQQVMMGSALSGFGMEKGVALNHAICHVLGGKFGVPHGDANSIIIPHGMRYNLDETASRQALLADALGVDTTDLSDQEAGERAIAEIEALRDAIDAPSHLREVGISRDDFETIAAEAIQDLPIANNPTDVTEDDIVSILDAAW